MTLINAETGEIVAAGSVAYWAHRIRPNLDKAAESMIAAGRDLLEAKASVAHGEWLPLLDELGLNERAARRLMAIAKNPAISNRTTLSDLPAGGSILAELASVDPVILEEAIESGDIGPATTARQATQFARSTQRTADDIEPGDKIVDDHGKLHLVRDVEETGDEVVIHTEDDGAIITAPDAVVNATPKKSTAPTKPDLGGGISHPARYSSGMVELFAEMLTDHGVTFGNVLDPFAGTGRIHELRDLGDWDTVGIELEPEWAAMSPHTIHGDALNIPFDDGHFAAIVTSPTYGNRLADSHNASDPEKRRSYTHDLGRKLSDGNSGAMQWGADYRLFHMQAWEEAARALRPGGLFLLNIKDHIRDSKRQKVTGWHVGALQELGLYVTDWVPFGAPSLKAGANADQRCTEVVIALMKGDD